MPSKTKITKEILIKTAYTLVREEGFEKLSTRSLAKKTGCSTQTIFSNFDSFEDLCQVVIELAYKKYLDTIEEVTLSKKYPEYKSSGIAYVRFAKEEKNLFKLLFMRDRSKEEIVPDYSWEKSIELIKNNLSVSANRAELFHLEMWTVVHGLAVMCATSFCNIDEELVSTILSDTFNGLKSQIGVEK